MAHVYRAVQWNAHKRAYDLILLAGILLYLGIFLGTGLLLAEPGRGVSPVILLMRATGTLAFLMLTIILAIGPLARLDARALPLLYNRRHFGVATFLVALVHALASLGWYFAGGVLDPVTALLASRSGEAARLGIPFEFFGAGALLILFLMAATSHDFWLKALTPALWKGLHMLVYPAYGLLVLHMAFGIVQDERLPVHGWVAGAGLACLALLHVAAGLREAGRRGSLAARPGGLTEVARLGDIGEGRAKIVTIAGGERIAIFKYDGRVAAVSNVCAHQMGPLGEGRVVDGLITCPWHGFQYRPETGCAPAPFTERIATYAVRLEGDRVLLDPRPRPAGDPAPPAVIGGT